VFLGDESVTKRLCCALQMVSESFWEVNHVGEG
jgi:hypothetical protein